MVFVHAQTPARWVSLGRPSTANGFFQPASPDICEERRTVIQEALKGTRTYASLTINDFQLWAGLDWKRPHYTAQGLERICTKLKEELWDELLPCLQKQMRRYTEDRKPNVPDKNTVSELGDVLWCVSGLATYEGIDLQRAIAHYLIDETGKASLRSNFGSLDRLFSKGFRPRFSRTLHNEEDLDRYELEPIKCLNILGAQLHLSAAKKLEDAQFLGDTIPAPALWAQDLEGLGQTYAQTIIFLAYYAHRWAGSTFTSVVKTNIEKISARVGNRHIDKTDGTRTKGEF